MMRDVSPQLVDETLSYLIAGYELADQVVDELRLLAIGIGGGAAFERAIELIGLAGLKAPSRRRLLEDRDSFIARMLRRPEALRAIAPIAFIDARALGELANGSIGN